MTYHQMEIDPSGRPLKRTGFEAVFAIALLAAWAFLMGGVFNLMGRGEEMAAAIAWPSFSLVGLACLSWWYAEIVVGRWGLIWPGSALGLIGPLSLGYAVALSTPELRMGPFMPRLALISLVAGVMMIPFLFRFRLPGLVSPIMTFTLVGVFLNLYGADMDRLSQVEGFSPRGIVAALMTDPRAILLFGCLAVGAVVMARRLDLAGENFRLAAARPLHLIGGGVLALVAGRLIAMLPHPLDLALFATAWMVSWAWVLRINRVAVLFAMHFALVKPIVFALMDVFGFNLSIADWSLLLVVILIVDMALWPRAHRLSRRLDWTLGPGGLKPPLERPGFLWRYWPYATEKKEEAAA
ncbi:MAG: hypothetical protein AAGF44_02710 [Pseudomonadota bacterium]